MLKFMLKRYLALMVLIAACSLPIVFGFVGYAIGFSMRDQRLDNRWDREVVDSQGTKRYEGELKEYEMFYPAWLCIIGIAVGVAIAVPSIYLRAEWSRLTARYNAEQVEARERENLKGATDADVIVGLPVLASDDRAWRKPPDPAYRSEGFNSDF